jgi:uncharacterized protein YjbJ (UPF0337 family)
MTAEQEIQMNQDRFGGICKQLGGKLMENWGQFTNNRRIENAGVRNQLAGRIQGCYGRSKEQAADELKDFFARNRRWDISNR